MDSFLCSNPTQYISALLLSLNIMMSLELPHINVLSKIDLIEHQGELAFSLEYYSEVSNPIQFFISFSQNPQDFSFEKSFCSPSLDKKALKRNSLGLEMEFELLNLRFPAILPKNKIKAGNIIICLSSDSHQMELQVQNLEYLLGAMNESLFSKRFQRLSRAICEVRAPGEISFY